MAKKKKRGVGGREVATAYKLLVVQERLKGTPQEDVASAFGVSVASVQNWTTLVRKHGPSALESKRSKAAKPGLRPLKTGPVRDQVVALKREHEQWGTRRIRDVLPRYVERELAAYLRCGVLAHGFTRVRCQACGDELVVAFSCKRRGICSSCTSRRGPRRRHANRA